MEPDLNKLNVNYLVETVEENKRGFTQRQFENAKKARRLYHIMGCPSIQNMKHLLRQRLIKIVQ